jgi:hypothetical protein
MLKREETEVISLFAMLKWEEAEVNILVPTSKREESNRLSARRRIKKAGDESPAVEVLRPHTLCVQP